jgi:predicted nucleic acid-binding protein
MMYVGGSVRLYFDNNVYNRPSDDLSVPRNRNEAQAVEELLARVEAGEITVISSFVVEFEHSLSPAGVRREDVGALIAGTTGEFVSERPEILQRARTLKDAGIDDQDALHLAAAEYAGVDYFVTCDDKLVRRAAGAKVAVVSPLDLVEESGS